MHWGVPLLLLALSIGTFIGAALYVRTLEFPHLTNERDCSNRAKLPKSCQDNKNCCGVWDASLKACRKGTLVDGMECRSERSVGPLAIVGVGVVLFVAFIVTLVMALRNR
jgi:hypothetical protein